MRQLRKIKVRSLKHKHTRRLQLTWEPSSHFMSARPIVTPKPSFFPPNRNIVKPLHLTQYSRKFFSEQFCHKPWEFSEQGKIQWPCKFLQRSQIWRLGPKCLQRTSSQVAVHWALAQGTRDKSLFISQSTKGGIRNYPRVFFRQPYLKRNSQVLCKSC